MIRNRSTSRSATPAPRPRGVGSFVIALLVASVATASAQDAPPQDWFKSITMNTFVSTTWSYNFNTPDTRKNALRVFDQSDNSFQVDVVELAFKKDVDAANSIGFLTHLTAGSSIPKVARSSGLNGGDFDIHQAYLSWRAPVGHGLRVDAGKFVTPAGYEVIDGYDGFNDNATRSFLFGYAIPFTHTGLRLSYAFSDALSAMVFVANGWDNAVDNNRSKTIGAQIVFAPVQHLTICVNGIHGPERDNNDSDNRSLLDLCATYVAGDLFTIGANADFGAERHAAIEGGDARWNGIAAYLRVNPLERFSLALRGEMFDDADGARTGAVQKLAEFTITPEYRPADHFVIRADFRVDASNARVFEKRNDKVTSQGTVTLNMIYHF